jgi:hypothetical protein
MLRKDLLYDEDHNLGWRTDIYSVKTRIPKMPRSEKFTRRAGIPSSFGRILLCGIPTRPISNVGYKK